jgi:dTDP-4-dehydrorhamnose 3,5-epimerase
MKELEIKGAWLANSPIYRDDRGLFREWFKATTLTSPASDDFAVMQANISVSQKGVIRGIHYSLVLEGQSKWITCVAGSIWDVIVDIRPTSPTFKKWVSVDLNADSGDSILISFVISLSVDRQILSPVALQSHTS